MVDNANDKKVFLCSRCRLPDRDDGAASVDNDCVPRVEKSRIHTLVQPPVHQALRGIQFVLFRIRSDMRDSDNLRNM